MASRLHELLSSSTAKLIMLHFGSVKAIKAASAEQLSAVKGVGPKLAEAIHATLDA